MTTSESSADAQSESPAGAADAGTRAADSIVAGLPGSVPLALAALALFASVVARGLTPALPGSRDGIAGLIHWSEVVASLASQCLVLGGALLSFRLIIVTLRERDLGIIYRLVAVPAGAGVLTLIMASASHYQEPGPSLGLAVASAVLALGAMPLVLASSRTRALGFVLGLAGASAFVHVVARVMAIKASDQALPSLFMTARGLATASLVLDVAAMVVVMLWLSASRRRAGIGVAVGIAAVAGFVAWGAVRGSGSDVPFWQVLAARSLSGMVRSPTPLLLPFIRDFVEVAAALVAAAAVLFPRKASGIQAAMAFALVARSSSDIPLLALCLVLAALLGPLIALPDLSAATPPPAPGPDGPTPTASGDG